MKTTELSPQEQIQLIEKTIYQAKDNLKRYSFEYLFWGWLTSLTALVNFIGLNYTSFGEYSYFVWVITPLSGWVYLVFHYRKVVREARQKTHIEYFLQQLWIVLGGVMLFFSGLSFFLSLSPLFFFPVLTGVGTLVSGKVLRFRLLILGGALLLLFPLIIQFVASQWHMLFYGVAILVAFVLPGYALKAQQEK